MDFTLTTLIYQTTITPQFMVGFIIFFNKCFFNFTSTGLCIQLKFRTMDSFIFKLVFSFCIQFCVSVIFSPLSNQSQLLFAVCMSCETNLKKFPKQLWMMSMMKFNRIVKVFRLSTFIEEGRRVGLETKTQLKYWLWKHPNDGRWWHHCGEFYFPNFEWHTPFYDGLNVRNVFENT